jgi:protein TonB
MQLIQGRFAVALGFSAAAHAGLAWMVNGQLASSAAPAQRALTVAMVPAAPRAVLNSIVVEPSTRAAGNPRVLLVKTYGPEQVLVARQAQPSAVTALVAPSQMRVISAVQRETINKPLVPRAQPAPRSKPAAAQASPHAAASSARASVHGKVARGADAGASQAVAGLPGADREALPASGNEPPAYPWSARAHGHQGRVVLSVWVSAEGQADRLAVLKSSGYPILDRAAVEAVERWRFQPARRGGLRTDSLLYVPVVFRLDDG